MQDATPIDPTTSPSVDPEPPLDAAAEAAAARLAIRRRRIRVGATLAAISIGWKVIVFTLGAAMPRWLIDDGIAQLPDTMRPVGAEALQTAQGLWNGPIERYGIVRRLRVVSVTDAPGDADGACRRGARVRAYTYFAIPYSEARTACDRGVVEYRVFRRRGGRTSAQ